MENLRLRWCKRKRGRGGRGGGSAGRSATRRERRVGGKYGRKRTLERGNTCRYVTSLTISGRTRSVFRRSVIELVTYLRSPVLDIAPGVTRSVANIKTDEGCARTEYVAGHGASSIRKSPSWLMRHCFNKL